MKQKTISLKENYRDRKWICIVISFIWNDAIKLFGFEISWLYFSICDVNCVMENRVHVFWHWMTSSQQWFIDCGQIGNRSASRKTVTRIYLKKRYAHWYETRLDAINQYTDKMLNSKNNDLFFRSKYWINLFNSWSSQENRDEQNKKHELVKFKLEKGGNL